MTKEKIIAMLEQYLRGMDFGRERTDSSELEEQQIELARKEVKELLEWVRTGDEELIRQISDISEKGKDPLSSQSRE